MPMLLPAFVASPDVNKVYNLDAFALLAALPDKSVDAFITDLPYGTTACSWDEIIPLAPMWAEVRRTLKPRGVFVTTASQPFTSKLVMSNLGMFRYEWIWEKTRATGFLDVKRKPLKQHENLLVFSAQQPNYVAQMVKGITHSRCKGNGSPLYSDHNNRVKTFSDEFYPSTIIKFGFENGLHPTQKPIELFEYLIATYTQPSDLVCDFCCGSGTTGVAARNLARNYILGDITPQYVDVARKRLAQPFTPNMFIMQESSQSLKAVSL